MKLSCLGVVLVVALARPSSGDEAKALGLLTKAQSLDMCKGRVGFIEDPTELCSSNFYFCIPAPGRAQRFRCDEEKEEVYRVAVSSCVPKTQHPDCSPPTTQPPPKTPSCPRGEVFQRCGTACPATCDQPRPGACTLQCVAGCFCPPKLVRGPNGSCLPLERCPRPKPTTTTTTTTTTQAAPPSCPLGEVFKSCGSPCEPTCQDPTPQVCPASCVSGCFCPMKAVRGPDGFCIPPQWCPEFTTVTRRTTTPRPTTPPLPKCGLNEVPSLCQNECPRSCEIPTLRLCQTLGCQPGCDCRPGYLRGPRGNCIPPKLCPAPTTTTTTTTTTTRPAAPPLPPILDCKPLPDGNYEDPRRPCSSEYVACWDGVATILECSPGLAYDVITDRCRPPKLVPWCGGEGSTPPPPTPPTRPPIFPTDVPTKKPSGICAGKADGPIPDPSKCARHYFVCVAEQEERMECAGGSYFDDVSGDCLFRQYVTACGGKATKKPPPPTTLPPQDIPFPFDCSNKVDGDFENPVEVCSALYISCVAGKAVLRECQTGLAYDVISNKCLEPEFVQWCPGGAATIPTEPTSPAPKNPPPFEFDCWGKADGFFENPVDRCSSLYVSCVAQEPTFMECPGKLKFDIWSGNCLLEPYIESCGGTPTQTPKPVTQRPPQNPGIVFDCSDKVDGDYENPQEVCASSYFSCSGGVSSFRVCPGITKFDVISGECLEEEYVKWCGGIVTEKPKTTIAPPQNPPFPFDCSPKKDGDYDHPSDACSPLYVSCSGGETRYRECHAPLVYDWDSGRCLERQYTDGCPGGKPTPPTAPNPPRLPAPGFDCTGLPDGVYAKNDCSESYFACVGEISEEVWCADRTTFDAETGDCLLREHIRGCGGTPTKKTPPPKPSPTVPAEPPAQECLDQGPGRYPSEPGCTQDYFVCDENNFRTEKTCPALTFFDAPSQLCYFRRRVDACGGGKVKPKPPVRPQTPPRPAVPRPEVPTSCVGLEDGFYGKDCGVKYVLCSKGKLTPGGVCPSSRRFKVVNGQGTCVPLKLCNL